MGSRAHRPCTAHATQSVLSIGYESAVAHCGRKNQQRDCTPAERYTRSIPGETSENLQTVGDLEEISGSELFHAVETRRLVKCGSLGEDRLALFQLNPIRFSIEIDSPHFVDCKISPIAQNSHHPHEVYHGPLFAGLTICWME